MDNFFLSKVVVLVSFFDEALDGARDNARAEVWLSRKSTSAFPSRSIFLHPFEMTMNFARDNLKFNFPHS